MTRRGSPAGPVDDDGAVAENSTPESLVHADAFNLVEKQFERSDLENPGLQDNPLVRHRKLGGGPSRGSGNYGNDRNQKTDDACDGCVADRRIMREVAREGGNEQSDS